MARFFNVTVATLISSHVKISCFRAKAHLVFHCCLYNNITSLIKVRIMNRWWCDRWYSYKRSHAFSWQDRVTSLFTKWKYSLWNRQNARKSIFWRKLCCTSKGSLSFRQQFLAVSLFTVSLSQNTGFHCSWGAFLGFNQWEFISDHYHLERSGTKNKNQSATEFKICTDGSEVCNWRDQRFFFLACHAMIAASPLNFAANYREKNPLVTRVCEILLNTWFLSNFHNLLFIMQYFKI